MQLKIPLHSVNNHATGEQLTWSEHQLLAAEDIDDGISNLIDHVADVWVELEFQCQRSPRNTAEFSWGARGSHLALHCRAIGDSRSVDAVLINRDQKAIHTLYTLRRRRRRRG